MTGAPVVHRIRRLEAESRWLGRVCLAAALLLAGWQLVGCGASALETHVQGLHASRAVLDVSREAIITGGQEACDEPCEPWLTAMHTHNTAVGVWETWLATIPLAEGEGDWTPAAALALRLVAVYTDLLDALGEHAEDWPQMPPLLARLAGR